jgi:hypothetical protein
MLSKRVPVPIERELDRSLFSMLEIDEGDAEEMEPAQGLLAESVEA